MGSQVEKRNDPKRGRSMRLDSTIDTLMSATLVICVVAMCLMMAVN